MCVRSGCALQKACTRVLDWLQAAGATQWNTTVTQAARCTLWPKQIHVAGVTDSGSGCSGLHSLCEYGASGGGGDCSGTCGICRCKSECNVCPVDVAVCMAKLQLRLWNTKMCEPAFVCGCALQAPSLCGNAVLLTGRVGCYTRCSSFCTSAFCAVQASCFMVQ